MDTQRACGPCTACCETLHVEELNKPACTPCRHQIQSDSAEAAGGCGIYTTRPAACRDFQCLWLRGLRFTGDGHRPDRSGLMLLPHAAPRTIEAVELVEGAARLPANAGLIETLRKAQLTVVVTNKRRDAGHALTPITVGGRPTVHVRTVNAGAGTTPLRAAHNNTEPKPAGGQREDGPSSANARTKADRPKQTKRRRKIARRSRKRRG